jgi:AbrB family looped-hinge helix DNA binding protein
MTETAISTVTSKGQVTVPQRIREALGVAEGDRLVFEVEGERAFIRKAPHESLTALFLRQKPWKIRAIPFQRGVRDEWTARRH